ncbi:PPIC-type PPIASE domain [Chthonomonas calidirosea]|uniref:peptidylprolyl isomerase n=1 Tax=Chthonomonas calidirosea (strain DSM 23976 / ICMP 18418 / T49) TaxID=1303518 RepID=S0ETH3_CHTCT|nr:peptidylprolyl isomerase [Chthonomonas calidirosea]CCW34810.1 PPIC-type PPIASE domain [Chthonomonas calidirosea T49]CEK13731.1 PPIC-type PPIASE domain [Chthonomonas calidirosea]
MASVSFRQGQGLACCGWRLSLRQVAGTLCLLLLPLLTGCQGDSIIAQVGGQSISMKRYYDTLENLTQADFSNAPDLQAGPLALLYLIREAATQQLAQQKGFIPSDDFIDRILEYQREKDPNLDDNIRRGLISESQLKKQLILLYEILTIGADTDHVDESQLKQMYAREKSQLDLPERFVVRMLLVKNEQDGIETLNRLKATGNFAAEAQRERDAPPFDGEEITVSAEQVKQQQPQLYEALEKLSPGQFADAPIPLKQPGAPTPLYVLVQLTHKMPAKSMSYEQVRPLLVEQYLQQAFPQYQQHFYQTLTEYLKGLLAQNKIVIYNQRYASIVLVHLNQLLNQPPPVSTPAPAQSVPTPPSIRGEYRVYRVPMHAPSQSVPTPQTPQSSAPPKSGP